MTNEQAREYWSRRLERAEGYSDEHWDAEERHAHKDYIDALKSAVTALAICREHEETWKPKTNGDKIRAMNDEELAMFLNRIIRHCREESCNDGCPMADCCACDYDWQEKWLKQEASEDAGSKTD